MIWPCAPFEHSAQPLAIAAANVQYSLGGKLSPSLAPKQLKYRGFNLIIHHEITRIKRRITARTQRTACIGGPDPRLFGFLRAYLHHAGISLGLSEHQQGLRSREW